MNSSEIKVIKRHILELDWIYSLYDTIDEESRKEGQPITRIEASENRYCEVIGFKADKYACLLNAYDNAENMDDRMIKDFDCDNVDPDFIGELNSNEKLIQKYYSEKGVTDQISKQKYKYFGLPKSKDSIYNQQYYKGSLDHGFIRDVRYRFVYKKEGEFGEWKNLHSDMALSINDIKYGVGASKLNIVVDDVKEWLHSTAGKILIAGAMMGLKKGAKMAITKVLKILVAGPMGLVMGGGGGGLKLLTDGKYQKPKRTKRTKRRKRKITQKPPRKR